MSALLCAVALALAPSELARVTPVQVPDGTRVRRAFLDDLNADGRSDLFLVTTMRGEERRRLAVHLGRAGDARFAQRADHTLDLTGDVVALAPADVDAAPGREVALWTARGIFAWRPQATDPKERFARLGEVELLWQLADDEDVILWRSGVRDVDGDGLPDLLSPEPEGYVVHLQRRDAGGARFEAQERHALNPAQLVLEDRPPVRTSDGATLDAKTQDRKRFELRIGGGGDVEDVTFWAGPLLRIQSRMPAPLLADWDADGDLDLVVQTPERLLVWRRGEDGAEPGLALPLPLEVDRARKLDVSFRVTAGELDGDGRVDCIVFAGDKRASDVRTQALVFTQAGTAAGEAPLFGDEGRPQQLLVLAGFAGGGRLLDVDGDGRDDLVVGSFRPDLLEQITGGSDSIELELDVFRNLGGRFSRRPDLATRIRISTEVEDAGTELSFVEDVGGDGVRDLLVREEERLALYLIRPARGGVEQGLERLGRPIWTQAIDDDAKVFVEELEQGRREVLVLRDAEVLHVEFGR
ncbi:MAG: VCBS repeat-containing protein [Planctomycetota bacterium]